MTVSLVLFVGQEKDPKTQLKLDSAFQRKDERVVPTDLRTFRWRLNSYVIMNFMI